MQCLNLRGKRGESRIMFLCHRRSCLAIIKPPELELNKKCPRCGFPRFSGEENSENILGNTKRGLTAQAGWKPSTSYYLLLSFL